MEMKPVAVGGGSSSGKSFEASTILIRALAAAAFEAVARASLDGDLHF